MGAKQLYINGIGTGEYGIYISSDTYLNAPAPDYVAHPIPGRSGDLLQWNNRLNNIARKFTCYIPDNAQSNMDGFKKLLYGTMGYLEISSDYEPDTYQRGYLAEEIEAEPFQSDEVLRVTFELIFSCEPQKYFKTNTEQSISILNADLTFMASNILPRNHPIIQAVFQQIPSGDIPNGDMFAMFQIGDEVELRYVDGVLTPDVVTAVTFSKANYEDFVAIAMVTYPWIPSASVVYGVVGYSSFGAVNVSGLSFTPRAGNTCPVVILPISVTGSFTTSVSKTTADGDNTQTRTITAKGSMGHLANANAIGCHYTVELGCTFKNYASSDNAYKDNTIGIVGTLNDVQTFNTVISFDAKAFKEVTQRGDTLNATVTINSEDMSMIGKVGDEYVKITNYVGILGELDGLADRIDLLFYRDRQTSLNSQPLFINSVKITPRWWKI